MAARADARRALLAGAFTAAALTAVPGCGRFADAFGPAHMPAAATLVGTRLLAAEEADEAPDEIVEFFEHQGEFKPRPAPRFPDGWVAEPVPPRPKEHRLPAKVRYRVGLRYGLFSPGESEYSWPQAQYFGFFLRRTPLGPHKMSAEFGGEYVKLETSRSTPGGAIFTRMYMFRADVLLGAMGSEKVAAYAVVGGQVVMEEADLYSERDVAPFGAGADVGFGASSADGRWELRGVYTGIVSPRRNAEGAWTISLGFAY